MKAYGASRIISSVILNLGCRSRWVVNFTHRPLYPRGKKPSNYWKGCSVGSKNQAWRSVREKIFLRHLRVPPRTVQPFARCLYRVNYPASVGYARGLKFSYPRTSTVELVSLNKVKPFLCCYMYPHCATSRKVAGSIPEGVIGIFQWHNPSTCTTALGWN